MGDFWAVCALPAIFTIAVGLLTSIALSALLHLRE